MNNKAFLINMAATYSPGLMQVSARGGHGGLIRLWRIGIGREKLYGEIKKKPH